MCTVLLRGGTSVLPRLDIALSSLSYPFGQVSLQRSTATFVAWRLAEIPRLAALLEAVASHAAAFLLHLYQHFVRMAAWPNGRSEAMRTWILQPKNMEDNLYHPVKVRIMDKKIVVFNGLPIYHRYMMQPLEPCQLCRL